MDVSDRLKVDLLERLNAGLAGCEGTKDAVRLRVDPTIGVSVGGWAKTPTSRALCPAYIGPRSRQAFHAGLALPLRSKNPMESKTGPNP